MKLCRIIDSGLAMIILIIISLLTILFTLLNHVKYEWCPVLFKNNTVSKSYHPTAIIVNENIAGES